MYTDGSIVTDPGFHSIGVWYRLVGVDRETSGGGETSVESDEDRFDGRPSLITDRTRVENCAGVEAMSHAIVPPFHCSARVRRENMEGATRTCQRRILPRGRYSTGWYRSDLVA